MQRLRDCLDNTDWSVFRESSHVLDEYTDVVTAYINFSENVHVQSKSMIIYSNNKPWFSRGKTQLWKNTHNLRVNTGNCKRQPNMILRKNCDKS